MLRLKRQLKLTSVVVTHDLELMRKVADTVVVLHEGKAIYFGPVVDLEKWVASWPPPLPRTDAAAGSPTGPWRAS